MDEVVVNRVTMYVPKVKKPGEVISDETVELEYKPWRNPQKAGVPYNRNIGQIVRGGIYFLAKENEEQQESHEIHAGRPVVVVSDSTVAQYGYNCTVVPLTTRNKTITKTRTVIRSSGKRAVALCDQVDTVDCGRLGNYIGKVSIDEMRQLKRCLAYHFGYYIYNFSDADESSKRYIEQLEAQVNALEAQLQEQTAIAKEVIVSARKQTN